MAKGQAKQKKPEPCCFVIFGVTGDLTHRLVIPALYNLAASNLLPENFCVAGVARKGVSGNALRNSLMDGLRKFATRPVDDEIAMRLLACITAIEADVRDPASFDAMRGQLDVKNVQGAIDFYQQAVALDPGFAVAYAGIADADLRM